MLLRDEIVRDVSEELKALKSQRELLLAAIKAFEAYRDLGSSASNGQSEVERRKEKLV